MKSLSMTGYLVSLLLFSTFLYGCPSSGGVEEVLGNVITTYGGEENLKKLNSYSQLWTMDALAKQDRGNDVRYVEQPGKLRVELFYEKNPAEQRIINGEKGYSASQGGGQNEARGPQLSAMKIQRARMYSPLTLKTKIASLTVRDEPGYKVLVLKEGEVTTKYYVNVQTNLIDKVVGILSMGGQNMEFVVEYSDFRTVEGVMVAYKENKFAMGMNTAQNTLKDLRLNVVHKDGFFM